MDDLRDLLELTTGLAAEYYDTLNERPVFPRASYAELCETIASPLPEEPADPRRVIEALAAAVDPGLVAEGAGRYFGFVIGGAVPASLAADWLTSAWDQNAGLYVGGPAAAVVEEVAGAWLLELLGLPADASFGFVTGGQMANFTGLAAARHHVLAKAGWDVERDGLNGAPRIRVIVGEKRHGTIDRSLRMLGLGAPTDIVPADDQGRLLADQLEIGDEPTIVCAQAGEVNTGAFDPFHAIADARDAAPNAWFHVDGAFGLWAAVSDSLRPFVDGVERADSWATDAHKWLNVPYDCGIAFSAHPESHSGCVLGPRRLPDLRRHAARADRLEPRALSARARVHGVCGDPFARTQRNHRARGTMLPPCPALRRRPRGSRRGGAERRRAEPGAVPLLLRRRDQRSAARSAGER